MGARGAAAGGRWRRSLTGTAHHRGQAPPLVPERKTPPVGSLRAASHGASAPPAAGLLSENNRLGELAKILEKFGDIAAEQRGQVLAVVTTADGLTREEAAEITSGLKQMLKPGQSLALDEKVDPSIIGGVVIDIGDKHVDMSILSRVRKLQQIVRDAV